VSAQEARRGDETPETVEEPPDALAAEENLVAGDGLEGEEVRDDRLDGGEQSLPVEEPGADLPVAVTAESEQQAGMLRLGGEAFEDQEARLPGDLAAGDLGVETALAGDVESVHAKESGATAADLTDGIEDLEPVGRWAILPESTTVHPDVDLGAEDPAANGYEHSDKRRCVAQRRDGHRCRAWAAPDSLACSFHDGRSDPRQAALASHEAQRARREGRERALALSRLGTRAVVADALVVEHDNVHRAVRLLARSAGQGDLKSAQALIPWIDQALGRPTERVEHSQPGTQEELESMETSALQALVAKGRERRLRSIDGEGKPEPQPGPSASRSPAG
jgi:hypothetical protein